MPLRIGCIIFRLYIFIIAINRTVESAVTEQMFCYEVKEFLLCSDMYKTLIFGTESWVLLVNWQIYKRNDSFINILWTLFFVKFWFVLYLKLTWLQVFWMDSWNYSKNNFIHSNVSKIYYEIFMHCK